MLCWKSASRSGIVLQVVEISRCFCRETDTALQSAFGQPVNLLSRELRTMIARYRAKQRARLMDVACLTLVMLLSVASMTNGSEDERSCTACVDQYQSFQDDYERTNDMAIMCQRVAITRVCLAWTQKYSRRCRSNIQLQVFQTGFKLEVRKYKCDLLNATQPAVNSSAGNVVPMTTVRPPQHVTKTRAEECRYKGERHDDDKQIDSSGFVQRHCGLFGDPHLRTFDEQSQTCVVDGAWPLLDSRHLAVQVTNVKLAEKPGATATSKITILLKESKTSCVRQKFYQVTAGHLPMVFRDGTSSTGPSGCQTTISAENEGVRLDMCHLNATIVIRPVGRYLTYSMRIPDEFVRSGVATGLCVDGCPPSERIDYAKFFELQTNSVERHASHHMLTKDAFMLCEKANLTDFYFDSCLFDLMTTGDRQFLMSARSAMSDAIDLNPRLRLTRDNSVALSKRTNFVSGRYDTASPSNNRSSDATKCSYTWTHLLLLLTLTRLILVSAG